MNLKKILFTVILALGCGAIIAQFYPYSFGDNTKGAIEVKEESKPFSELASDDLSVRDVLTIVENKNTHDMCESIFFILKNRPESEARVYAMPIMEYFVRETPDQAVASMKGDFFRNQKRSHADHYVRLFFGSLGKFYPRYLSRYFKYLNEDPSMGFTFNETAINSFFEQLVSDDPEKAYRMITDGNLDELKEYANVPDKDWNGIIEKNRKMALSFLDGGLSEIFLSELKSKNMDWEMFSLIEKNLSKENYERVFDWMVNNFSNGHFYSREIINRISKYDLDDSQLLAMATKVHSKSSSPWNSESLVETLAVHNPELALNFIEENLSGESRERSLAVVLKELNKTRPVSEMKAMVEGLSEGMCKEEMVPVIFAKYYKESPDEAVAWYMEQKDSLSSFTWNLSNRSGLNADAKTTQGAEMFARFVRLSDSTDVSDRVSLMFANENVPQGEKLINELSGEKQQDFAYKFYSKFMQKNFEEAKKSFESNDSISENVKIREEFDKYEKENRNSNSSEAKEVYSEERSMIIYAE